MAGAAVGIGGVGAVLALADVASPLRAPCTLFFLIAAPACAVAASLRGLDPLTRGVVAVAGAAAVDLLTAQAMLALHIWSIRGGITAVAGLSLLLLLPALVRRPRGRTTRTRTL
ncbi:hypothetical protein ABZW18_07655 [Streptomyces sp. NPDC004647]|uniref:hypothetical protein n=1 Tax=Streptomyces sp. NPDC004647 TaxID=3154671 RepID=UPI0033A596F0